ncbi:MAG: response regulator [Candidatus Synoicihabitans palmerolidicus]|nr:response regulator [Candidatus Synoicihabitans palmerolidicus]
MTTTKSSEAWSHFVWPTPSNQPQLAPLPTCNTTSSPSTTKALSANSSASSWRLPDSASPASPAKTLPHLIITDLQLEDSDGLELVAELNTIVPGAPVILLTGILCDNKTVDEKLSSKISSSVNKPVPLDHLMDEIKRLLAAS